jgi:hypothetical protein
MGKSLGSVSKWPQNQGSGDDSTLSNYYGYRKEKQATKKCVNVIMLYKTKNM